jgi:hypothetical protein
MSLFDAAPILCAGVVRATATTTPPPGFLIWFESRADGVSLVGLRQTVYKALKTAGLTTGESVVITGAGGGLGHLAVQYARVSVLPASFPLLFTSLSLLLADSLANYPPPDY